MIKPWFLLPAISAPMPFQMALDEILLSLSSSSLTGGSKTLDPRFRGDDNDRVPVLRFYFSSEPWVSVGYSCRFDERRHVSFRRPEGGEIPGFLASLEMTGTRALPICRRITGGGRVEHGQDLIFSLIAAKEADESFKSVRTSYWKIHEAVKAGLEKALDVGAGFSATQKADPSFGGKPTPTLRFYRCDENLPKGEDCFRFPIATDLALGGRKIAGGAQKRSGGAFLHQESIQPIPGFAAEDLIVSIQRGFEEVFGVKIENMDLRPEWLDEAEKSEVYLVKREAKRYLRDTLHSSHFTIL